MAQRFYAEDQSRLFLEHGMNSCWQQQQNQQQQQQPVGMPVPFPGFQVPLRPAQVFMPQPMPYYQAPQDAPYFHDSLMSYPLYAQPHFTQQQQQSQDLPNGYGGSQAYFQAGYVPCMPQWSPQLAWHMNKDGGGEAPRALPQTDMHSESSSGRSPNKIQNFNGAGADRGWKRNRDGSINGKRPDGWQKNGNFRACGNRPALRCESCDRSFVGRNQMDAHMKTHTKCNIEGCSFEGIGKAVNEHRQQVHGKKGPNSGNLRPITKEGEEDIRKWREARRKNYPTAANLQKKLQDMQARRERGELIDEDALMRQESLKQILAKQAELGCAVAEVPAYYLSQRYAEKGLPNSRQQGERPAKVARIFEEQDTGKRFNNNNRRQGKKICVYYQKGHCKKGGRCHFLHDGGNNNRKHNTEESSIKMEENHQVPGAADQSRQSLLSKLLSSEIKRDKSHLLQCFRFLVNNNFLVDPNAPVKMFEWAENDCDENSQKLIPAVVLEDDLVLSDEDQQAEGDEDEETESQEEEEEDEFC